MLLKADFLLRGLAVLTTSSGTGLAGTARDCLYAPIDVWLTFYSVGYCTSVTPEDGMDVTSLPGGKFRSLAKKKVETYRGRSECITCNR
jgi:hypothetical protein